MGRKLSLTTIGSLLAFLGVALGAFGAHGLEQILSQGDRQDLWDTAVFYHLVHALAVLVAAQRCCKGARIAAGCFATGVVLFSGSLFVLAIEREATWLGAITPLGGVLFLVGWIFLARSGMGGWRSGPEGQGGPS